MINSGDISNLGGVITSSNNSTSYSSFTNSNTDGVALSGTGGYIGVIAESSANSGYDVGLAALGYNLSILAANKTIRPTNNSWFDDITLRLNSANMDGSTAPQVGIGTGIKVRLPILKPWTNSDPKNSDLDAGKFGIYWSDITKGSEDGEFKVLLTHNGVVDSTAMSLSSSGLMTIGSLKITSGVPNKFLSLNSSNEVIYVNPPASTYTLILPNAASVAGRCSAAVAGVNYPAGWTIGAWAGNPNDLLIVHALAQRIAHVSIFSVSGTSERQMFGNAAYSGIIAPDQSSLRIEGLATIATTIVIHLIFA